MNTHPGFTHWPALLYTVRTSKPQLQNISTKNPLLLRKTLKLFYQEYCKEADVCKFSKNYLTIPSLKENLQRRNISKPKNTKRKKIGDQHLQHRQRRNRPGGFSTPARLHCFILAVASVLPQEFITLPVASVLHQGFITLPVASVSP